MSGLLPLLGPGPDASPEPISWVHPGHGEACGSTGEPVGWWGHSASGKMHANPIVERCDSFDCPTCWRPGWMHREAEDMADVLTAEREGRISRGRSRGIVHFTVNPPPELYDSADYREPKAYAKLRTRAAKIARAAGMQMFSLTPHHERCADRDDPVTTDGVHFHGLGFGWIDKEQYWRTGWVVKNHGVRKTRRSLLATAEYFLSHSSRLEARAGISPMGKSASPILVVTWYGRTPKLVVRPEKGRWCHVCHELIPRGNVLRLHWEGQGPPPEAPTETDVCLWRASVLDRTSWFEGREVRISL